MATLREIRRRVKSVKNISQITSAMQMVAASKMRRAQEKTQKFKPYALKIAQLTRELSLGVDSILHELLQEGNPEGKRLIILITTDKGLCGGLNSNLFRQLKRWYPDLRNLECITVGKKGRGFVRLNNLALVADFSGTPLVHIVSAVTTLVVENFLAGMYLVVEIIFNRFVTSFEQQPTRWPILPISEVKAGEEKEVKVSLADFLIEPSAREVLEALIPEYLENQIRDAALSAEASEYSARMVAMKNATENAQNLVADLTLEFNKLRQNEITMSIADMVTARIAVEA